MKITEDEFSKICTGIREDRESIIRHNPIGSEEEILLWMLLSSLTLYLNLTEIETPCFTARPDAATYRNAITYILEHRKTGDFQIEGYFESLLKK
jgi:hypothetical protein